jgi:hypothetical protein
MSVALANPDDSSAKRVHEIYEHALRAADQNDLSLAASLLIEVVSLDSSFLQAHRLLRIILTKHFGRHGFFALVRRGVAMFTTLPFLIPGWIARGRRKPEHAMVLAYKALSRDPWNLPALDLLVRTCHDLHLLDVAQMVAEWARMPLEDWEE